MAPNYFADDFYGFTKLPALSAGELNDTANTYLWFFEPQRCDYKDLYLHRQNKFYTIVEEIQAEM